MALRWGIVGFGWVARDYMVPAMSAAGHELAAVCDPSSDAQAAARALGAEVYERLDAFLADPSMDAVYVATPNHLHRPAVEAAARAGKAVLCEKPMAATLADAEAMAAACRQAGVLYGTAFDQRHHPAHRAVRAEIRAGRVGVVTAVRIVYACWVGRDWSACRGQDNWRIDAAKAGGGALMDLAPHGLDLVEYLLDEPVVEIRALTQRRVQDFSVDDGALLIGRARSGVLVFLHIAYNCPEGLPRRRLEVVGATGQLVALNTMGQEPGGALSFIDGATGVSSPVSVPDADGSPFLNQVRAFARALDTGDRAAFSLERDLHTMRLLEQAYAGANNPGPADACPAAWAGPERTWGTA
jgi:1,5-anhydro-D-fructose reductase (1,5-anhydro-D-mannitol-forming)